MNLDHEFSFSAPDEPVLLPVGIYRECLYGKHFLPATSEHFSLSHDSKGRLQYAPYCRPCMATYCRERKRRIAAEKKGGKRCE